MSLNPPPSIVRRHRGKLPLHSKQEKPWYRDFLLVLIGAIVSLGGSIATSLVQGSIQRDNLRFEKRFVLLREAYDFHHAEVARLQQAIDSVEPIFLLAAQSIEEGKPLSSELSAKFDKAFADLQTQSLEYESKVDTFLPLLFAAFGTTKVDLRFTKSDPGDLSSRAKVEQTFKRYRMELAADRARIRRELDRLGEMLLR